MADGKGKVSIKIKVKVKGDPKARDQASHLAKKALRKM